MSADVNREEGGGGNYRLGLSDKGLGFKGKRQDNPDVALVDRRLLGACLKSMSTSEYLSHLDVDIHITQNIAIEKA